MKKARFTVTVDYPLFERIGYLLKDGKIESVSGVVEECLYGFLHIIESEAGPKYRQADRVFTNYQTIKRFLSAILDPDIYGEAMALVYDKKSIKERLENHPEKKSREALDKTGN